LRVRFWLQQYLWPVTVVVPESKKDSAATNIGRRFFKNDEHGEIHMRYAFRGDNQHAGSLPEMRNGEGTMNAQLNEKSW